MNHYKNENSLKNILSSNRKTSKKISFLNLKILNKLLDSLNISLLFLIILLSFLSFNSQRKWTNIYKTLAKTKMNSNNLLDYISKTEEFYIHEIDSLRNLKKTTPKDLLYINKQNTKQYSNNSNKKINYIYEGLKDSKYQKGY